MTAISELNSPIETHEKPLSPFDKSIEMAEKIIASDSGLAKSAEFITSQVDKSERPNASYASEVLDVVETYMQGMRAEVRANASKGDLSALNALELEALYRMVPGTVVSEVLPGVADTRSGLNLQEKAHVASAVYSKAGSSKFREKQISGMSNIEEIDNVVVAAGLETPDLRNFDVEAEKRFGEGAMMLGFVLYRYGRSQLKSAEGSFEDNKYLAAARTLLATGHHFYTEGSDLVDSLEKDSDARFFDSQGRQTRRKNNSLKGMKRDAWDNPDARTMFTDDPWSKVEGKPLFKNEAEDAWKKEEQRTGTTPSANKAGDIPAWLREPSSLQ